MRRSIPLRTLLAPLLVVSGLGLSATAPAPVAAAETEALDVPVTLRGSLNAMRRQHGVAQELGYTFVRTSSEMARLERNGDLVRLTGNDDYSFREGVYSAVTRPETGIFIERLAAEYREACGEKLVVTSLTRPLNRQPRNAHRLSVHPAGIAVDLRVSRSADCRSWLEGRLLEMEEAGVLDVTRERFPPHYHVALFPEEFVTWVQPILHAEWAAEEAVRAEELAGQQAAEQARMAEAERVAAERRREEAARTGLLAAFFLPAAAGLVFTARRRRPRTSEG